MTSLFQKAIVSHFQSRPGSLTPIWAAQLGPVFCHHELRAKLRTGSQEEEEGSRQPAIPGEHSSWSQFSVTPAQQLPVPVTQTTTFYTRSLLKTSSAITKNTAHRLESVKAKIDKDLIVLYFLVQSILPQE